MKRTAFAKWPCSVARTTDLLGDWWTPLVLRELFYGAHRFDEIQTRLAIGRNILTMRLRRLEREGILSRHAYQAGPARYDYRLTPKGAELMPILITMMAWGDKWLATGGAYVRLKHVCGRHTQGELVCTQCKGVLRAADLVAEPGPGMDVKRLGKKARLYFGPR